MKMTFKLILVILAYSSSAFADAKTYGTITLAAIPPIINTAVIAIIDCKATLGGGGSPNPSGCLLMHIIMRT